MAISWLTYRRHITRFPVARLVVMGIPCTIFALLPYLESSLLWPAPIGVLTGLVVPLAARRFVTLNPALTQRWLRVHGILLGLLGWLRGAVPDQILAGIAGLATASWCSIWFILHADDEVVFVASTQSSS